MSPLPFRWDANRMRYVAPNGRFVSRDEVRKALDATYDRGGISLTTLNTNLRTRVIGVDEWVIGMRRVIKNAHLQGAALALGGWDQLTKRDLGRIGSIVKFHYGYLDGFANEIRAGYPLDGRFQQRTTLYVEAGRNTYHVFDEREHREAGYTEERSILSGRDHCYGCIQAARAGWQPIGSLPPIGDRDCVSRCRCTMDYR